MDMEKIIKDLDFVYATQPMGGISFKDEFFNRTGDGYVACSSFDQCWLRRPDEVHGVYDPRGDTVKHGICLVDREGKNFRWVTASTTTFDWRVVETSKAEIKWTLDGRYIIFLAKDVGQWHYYDVETGERGRWKADLPVQDSQQGYVELPYIHIPKETFIKAGVPCTGTCLDEGQTGIGGSLYVDGRYVTWVQSYGESDPQYLVAYDMQAKRLLCLARTSGFHLDQPMWLPEP